MTTEVWHWLCSYQHYYWQSWPNGNKEIGATMSFCAHESNWQWALCWSPHRWETFSTCSCPFAGGEVSEQSLDLSYVPFFKRSSAGLVVPVDCLNRQHTCYPYIQMPFSCTNILEIGWDWVNLVRLCRILLPLVHGCELLAASSMHSWTCSFVDCWVAEGER